MTLNERQEKIKSEFLGVDHDKSMERASYDVDYALDIIKIIGTIECSVAYNKGKRQKDIASIANSSNSIDVAKAAIAAIKEISYKKSMFYIASIAFGREKTNPITTLVINDLQEIPGNTAMDYICSIGKSYQNQKDNRNRDFHLEIQAECLNALTAAYIAGNRFAKLSATELVKFVLSEKELKKVFLYIDEANKIDKIAAPLISALNNAKESDSISFIDRYCEYFKSFVDGQKDPEKSLSLVEQKTKLAKLGQKSERVEEVSNLIEKIKQIGGDDVSDFIAYMGKNREKPTPAVTEVVIGSLLEINTSFSMAAICEIGMTRVDDVIPANLDLPTECLMALVHAHSFSINGELDGNKYARDAATKLADNIVKYDTLKARFSAANTPEKVDKIAEPLLKVFNDAHEVGAITYIGKYERKLNEFVMQIKRDLG